ncbi:YbhB/YbcL family Raf kinase inhibitor-like protein [Pasteurellaceae bacterium TAE3-ERU1]|nr:YbhB/YbcL family Raf kinase inhibitor-like protein [Pasteurellaceae bacterium TAE3-ERU1]
MKVTSSGITNGVIDDKYGKRGALVSDFGMPTCSLPLEISGAPAGTKSFAIVLEDKDAVPVCGYTWIHWLAANIKREVLEENDSTSATDYVQGTNSWSGKIAGQDRLHCACYGGMAPPDKAHRYEFYVYALDCELELDAGFHFNELHFAMQGHILAQAYLVGTYDA